ncbi:hypothetical protein ABG067_004617 [Albugo candida]
MLARRLSRQLLHASSGGRFWRKRIRLCACFSTDDFPELPKDELALSPNVESALNYILELNMLEIAELSRAVQKQFDLPEPTLGMGGGSSASGNTEGASTQAKEETKTAFDVKLVSFDAKMKIKVIKEIRAITGLGLKEAKELVEGAPNVIKKDVKKDEAEELIAKLSELGAVLAME